MLEGIAQDIFFHPTELNFYDSRWVNFFDKWAIDANDQYKDQLKSRPHLSKFTFFAEDMLDWKGMKCSLELNGCTRMPTPEMVRNHFSDDRFKARQVIYVLDAFRKLQVEINTYQHALLAAKTGLSEYCGEFAQHFFHAETAGKKQMCAAQIIRKSTHTNCVRFIR